MKKTLLNLVFSTLFAAGAAAQSLPADLPLWKAPAAGGPRTDWLVSPVREKAGVYRDEQQQTVILYNGLLKRSFRLRPELTCTDFSNPVTGEQLLRAVGAEAILTINGKNYTVGGSYGQKQRAYLRPDDLADTRPDPAGFHYRSLRTEALQPYLNWKPKGWAAVRQQPRGITLHLLFTAGLPELQGIQVEVNYELYEGIPLLCKSVSVQNNSGKPVKLNSVINENLAVHEEESAVAGTAAQLHKPHGLYIESNYAYNNSMSARLSDQTTHWLPDTAYTAQVNYALQTPCLLQVYPPSGPGVLLLPGQHFNSIRTNELLLDSYDRERNGLAQRKMYTVISPWTTENPIFMHLVTVDQARVRAAVDQCAATGYEAIILSFGSGIVMEDTSAVNLKYFRSLADYAHSKGIMLGGYSLFSSQRINDEEDVIDPKTGKADLGALFGKAPCLGSNWGLGYLQKLRVFLKSTGFDLFENDGPYPGDLCASVKHPGHRGLEDSQWAQMELQKGLYHWCSENGIYVNAPDWYFLDGSNKIALGYREVNFSLPREQQVLLNRQNIYDGTWEKMPSMSWGFVPLTVYHGGGEAATLEPLSAHLGAYEQLMMQYYGAGIQACYRGPRLYDTEVTRQLVAGVISWYKKYRVVLNAPVIHLRRADGRDWDGIMHALPSGKVRGIVMLYNPLDQAITRVISLPLYYTGLNKKVRIGLKEGRGETFRLDGNQALRYTVTLPARGYTWLRIEQKM